MTSRKDSMPRVLVIDDNEDILGFLHEILSNSGYHSLRQAYTLPTGNFSGGSCGVGCAIGH